MTYKAYDEFAGWGGSSQGITVVPGMELALAANHDDTAVQVHQLNFPYADHYRGDIAKADIAKFPRADFFWSSPACPPWCDARGVKRDFDKSNQGVLFDPVKGPSALDPKVARARALIEEVPRYLQAMRRKGRPVLGGVVENVVQVRLWAEFGRWRREIEAEGYRTRVIALNAMHVRGPRLGRVAQSRDRFWMAYWLAEFGRDPDWDKWLRPPAWCGTCEEVVSAIQVWKKDTDDMGRYGRYGQYVYRCPWSTCRHQLVEPFVLGADTIIDWSLDPGQRIGERVDKQGRPDPLEDTTLERIAAGLVRHARPLLCPAGGTWRQDAAPLDQPMATRTTRKTDGLVVPPPFISVLRGGGSKTAAYPVNRPIPTVSAQGNHHGLVEPSPESAAFLLAYYSNGPLRPVGEPVGTLTTKDRYALVGATHPIEHADVREAVNGSTFRMLVPREIAAGMGFRPDYQVPATVSRKKEVRGYGNAVPPAVSEVLTSALVETFSGEPLEPAA